MKKVVLFLLCIIIITGCSSRNSNINNEPDDESTVILEGISYNINQDDEGYGIKYKVASNFRKSEQINNISYYSEDIDNQPYFVIRLFQYNNKSVDYVINDIATEYDGKTDLKINELDYTFIHFINFSGSDVNIYIHKQDNKTYAITFTSKVDTSRLEDLFLNSIAY